MAIKIAIANMKGGVAKTTTAVCLADGLRRKRKKVLLIDTDPQQSATGVYGAKTEDVSTLADIMYCDTKAEECIQHMPLGDIIASDTALKEADTQIKSDPNRFFHLSDACEQADKDYDFIICDCGPGDNVLLGNALSFVDYVVMPVSCNKFGLQGMVDFSREIEKYRKRINPRLSILGVLIVMYKGRQSLTQDLENNLIPQLVGEMNTHVFKTHIRESVKCQEAQALGKSLFEHAPTSTTAEDYKAFIDELLKEVKKK